MNRFNAGWNRKAVGIVSAGVLVLTLAAAQAGLLYTVEESFGSPLNGVPEHWSRVWRTGTGPDNGVSEIRDWGGAAAGAPDAGRGLYAVRTVGTSGSANIVYSGLAGSANEDGILADYSGSILFTSTIGTIATSSWVGVLLRSPNAMSQFDNPGGYFVAFTGNTTNTLAIYKNPGGHSSPGTLLRSTDFTLSTSANYRLEFSVVGNQITAAAYQWNATEEAFSDLQGSILSYTDTDAPYSEGYFALRSSWANTNRYSQFADLELGVIPEPGSVTLVFLGAGALALRRRVFVSR